MSELYNHYIDVEDLEDIELNHLKRNISAEPAVETCIRLIERFFMQRLVDANCNYQRTHHAIRQIINQPQIDVNTLAESACLGYRQFKRVFSNYVGMSPKEYYRVVSLSAGTVSVAESSGNGVRRFGLFLWLLRSFALGERL